MDYHIEIRPLAALDILEAFDWYEEQRSGLGDEFLAALDQFYEGLLINPEIHSYYDHPVREGKVPRFPYTVVYEVVESAIVIYSVFMSRQHPDKKRSK